MSVANCFRLKVWLAAGVVPFCCTAGIAKNEWRCGLPLEVGKGLAVPNTTTPIQLPVVGI
jgi:hypothetical protein